MTWKPGDHIILRWVGHRAWLDEKAEKASNGAFRPKGGLLQGWPHVVIEDSDRVLALWMPAGSVTRLVDLSKPGDSEPTSSVWRRDTLRLMFPGKSYSRFAELDA